MSSWQLLIVGVSVALAAAEFTPARLVSGAAPMPPPNVIGWGWVVADVTVDAKGRHAAFGGAYDTPPYAELLWKSVIKWSFEPANDGQQPVQSHVLVVGCYRPAALLTGPDSRPPSVAAQPNVPTPVTMVPPAYPPNALGDGAAIVEVRVDTSGAVTQARMVRSAPGFDRAALDAARQWRFRAAHRAGVAVPAYVYLIFGFRQPVAGS